MEFYQMTALELADKIRNKEISSQELVSLYLERLEKLDASIRAYVTLSPERALQTAREVDDALMQGEELPYLAGVPVAVKDNISTRDIPTSCGSQMLKDYLPPYHATVVQKLQRHGLPVLGKTNMDEFAMGSSTENSSFFPTKNPWNTERVPGGSSGGSAAAVAARLAPLAIGSDTGGSVRQPAAFCGVTGLRPTYGSVSRYGLIAFASSLDQVGPLAANARDCQALFDIIAGYDKNDATSLRGSSDAERATCGPKNETFRAKPEEVKGLRIGIIREQSGEGFDPEIMEKLKVMSAFWESLGCEVEEISLPFFEYALSAYYLINPAEASSNLGRYDGIRYGLSSNEASDVKELFLRTRGEGFGSEVKRRIILGTYALSAGYYDDYYLKAIKVRTLIRENCLQALEKFDVLLGPTTPTPAFSFGEKTDDPLAMYLSDVCTIIDALAGTPAVSVFGGLTSYGLPVGIQMSAAPLQEDLLFKLAHIWEEHKDIPIPPVCYANGGATNGS